MVNAVAGMFAWIDLRELDEGVDVGGGKPAVDAGV